MTKQATTTTFHTPDKINYLFPQPLRWHPPPPSLSPTHLEQGPRAAVSDDAAGPAGVSPDPHLGVIFLRLDGVLRVSETFELGHHAVGAFLAPGILLSKPKFAKQMCTRSGKLVVL